MRGTRVFLIATAAVGGCLFASAAEAGGRPRRGARTAPPTRTYAFRRVDTSSNAWRRAGHTARREQPRGAISAPDAGLPQRTRTYVPPAPGTWGEKKRDRSEPAPTVQLFRRGTEEPRQAATPEPKRVAQPSFRRVAAPEFRRATPTPRRAPTAAPAPRTQRRPAPAPSFRRATAAATTPRRAARTPVLRSPAPPPPPQRARPVPAPRPVQAPAPAAPAVPPSACCVPCAPGQKVRPARPGRRVLPLLPPSSGSPGG